MAVIVETSVIAVHYRSGVALVSWVAVIDETVIHALSGVATVRSLVEAPVCGLLIHWPEVDGVDSDGHQKSASESLSHLVRFLCENKIYIYDF